MKILPALLAAALVGAALTPSQATAASATPAASTAPHRAATGSHLRPFDGGFTIASLNMLGNSHTAPGGNKPGWDAGAVRTGRALSLLTTHRVDLVGLQEFQRPQYDTFTTLAARRFGVYSAPGDTENAVAWRTDRFAMVSARTVAIPYFAGHDRQMPVVRLRMRGSGQQLFVADFHNPADTARFHHQGAYRAVAARREVTLVHTLERSGLPVFIVGDMNEKSSYFCTLAGHTDMRAAFGGSYERRCAPPPYRGIDWIFGNRMVTFADAAVDHTPQATKTTDHPLVTARVHYLSPRPARPTTNPARTRPARSRLHRR